MEQWTSTLDTRCAAACGTLGIPSRIETTFAELTGVRTTRFHLGLQCVEGIYKTKRLLADYKSGALEKADPAHPFLTIQRAFLCRNSVLDLQNKGIFCRLARVPGTSLWQYVPAAEGLPGLAGHAEVLQTTDLKLVAALGVIGHPLLKLEGTARAHTYFLPRWGPFLGENVPRTDAVALRAAWLADKGSIPWENPFAQAMRGLHNRERFLDAVNKDVELILFIKPRTAWKSAFVRADAAPAAFDHMKRHFDA